MSKEMMFVLELPVRYTGKIVHGAEYHEQYEKEHGESCPDCRDMETPE